MFIRCSGKICLSNFVHMAPRIVIWTAVTCRNKAGFPPTFVKVILNNNPYEPTIIGGRYDELTCKVFGGLLSVYSSIQVTWSVSQVAMTFPNWGPDRDTEWQGDDVFIAYRIRIWFTRLRVPYIYPLWTMVWRARICVQMAQRAMRLAIVSAYVYKTTWFCSDFTEYSSF